MRISILQIIGAHRMSPNLSFYDYCIANNKLTLLNEWDREKNEDITPQNVAFKSRKKVWWRCKEGHKWQATVYNRANGTGCPYCVRQRAQQRAVKGVNDLATVAPEVAAQWHPTKNGELTPETTTAKSRKKVWWQCKEGHEWQAKVYNRTNGTGCPYCKGKNVGKGFISLATAAPEVAAQWHPTKNGNLTPETVPEQSGKKVWWQCKEGHEWLAVVYNRTNGTGCPHCAQQRRLTGDNNLATVAPDVAAQWHPTLNEGATPETIAAKSGKKVWWQCKEGHEWLAIVRNRTNGSGCPFCHPRTPKALLERQREMLREAKEKLEKQD